MLTALLLVLLILWLLGYLQVGNVDFLRTNVTTIAGKTITVLDVLIGFASLWLVVALRGPIALAALVLLGLWAMSVFGFVVIEGIPMSALIVLVMIVGLMMHILTRRATG